MLSVRHILQFFLNAFIHLLSHINQKPNPPLPIYHVFVIKSYKFSAYQYLLYPTTSVYLDTSQSHAPPSLDWASLRSPLWPVGALRQGSLSYPPIEPCQAHLPYFLCTNTSNWLFLLKLTLLLAAMWTLMLLLLEMFSNTPLAIHIPDSDFY